jgi:hypothetical protein
MHKIRTIDVSDRRRARAKITNDRKRASGELTEIAKRAYRTRRSNYSEADINNQYKRIGEINSEIAKKRNFDARINTIDRIAAILTRKSPLLILRMFYVNGGVKIYGVLIDELVELGFLVFENFRNKKFRYAARNGFKFLHGCAECGEPCNIRHKFCSYVCKDRNLELNENKSVVMKIYYSVQENKQKTGDIGKLNHAKKTAEERHLVVKKIYNGRSQEWIDNKSRKAVDTRISKGQILPKCVFVADEYKLYKNLVSRFTKTNRFNVPNIELRGKHTFHLDHIYPIIQGFLNKIPAELIGDLRNLQMLPAIENRQKNGIITIVPEHIQEWIDVNDNKREI